MNISTEVFKILTDIVEILSTPAVLGVQPADHFFVKLSHIDFPESIAVAFLVWKVVFIFIHDTVALILKKDGF